MKRFFYIFASLLILAGCSDRLIVEGGHVVPDGEMLVNLGVDGPMAGPRTRSYVNGTETAISAIKMICFDSQGAFITSRDGTVVATDDTHGTLTGTVPANTARIHFVANFNVDLSSIGLGSLERVVMKSALLSSGITDDVRFWGYHKEASPSAMASFLKNENQVNKITLIRDRAKITVVNSDSDIKSLQWTVSNGLNKGFVAAASSSDNSNPYDNNYTSGTILTEYRSAGTYTLSDSESIWTGPGADNPQFLFENSNSTSPVKIIVKATYQDDSERYHTILLQDDDKKLYRIYRNQSFVLTILDLPSQSEAASIGSASFEDAVSTTNYSNNPYAQVAREVNEVNNEQFRLTVEDVSVIFDSGTTGTISFIYSGHDGGSVSGISGSDFEASWEPKSDDDERPDVSPVTTAPTVTFTPSSDGTTGTGTVTFSLNTVNTELKFNSLQLVSPSGLTRYVDVYSISAFQFTSDPAFVDNGTTRTVGGTAREVYKLTFAIPNSLPEAAYPLKVRMYTRSLTPFSDYSASTPHGSFSIVSAPTSDLDGTDQATQWNFNATNWGYWYEYSVNAPGDYTIYLTERCLDYISYGMYSTVGLFFEVDNFGDMKSLYAASPYTLKTATVPFAVSDFTRNGQRATATKEGITVTLRRQYGNIDVNNNLLRITADSNNSNRRNGYLSFSSAEHDITKVVVNFGADNYTISSSSDGWTKSTTVLTWEGTPTTSISEKTVTRSSGQVGVSSVNVTYQYYAFGD